MILETILAYLINLASGERSAAIAASRERKLKELFAKEDALKKALDSFRPIRDEVSLACAALARDKARLGVTAKEEPLWRLLSDDVFQSDLAEWLMAGAIKEGIAAKDRLLHALERALSAAGAKPEQISFLKTGYFDAVEKAVFANSVLAHWRHQQSLDYLRGQVAALTKLAEEAAGVFSAEKQKAAIDCYCEKALAAWDIIDLSSLPEGDIHMATQKLLLRQLYMPLRIEFEPTKQGEAHDVALARLEAAREARRHREAGHSMAEPDLVERESKRVPIGERLAESRRLVVLGDPGGGKTTILRWMATAYLLKHKGDDAFSQVPDTQSLPLQPWIPVLIRCRDLGEADLCSCFEDFLTQHLNKTELRPEEAEVMCAVILDRVAKGEALLLVDGLDEITNPRVRVMFCQELERTAVRYPDAPIIVASRIVGYRDMPYRMGSGFEHGQIAELRREDKDLFAQRWVEVTEQYQSREEKATRVRELLDALHSNDRIERLTGNPMLLTTLALVKRKVGKLPNRRTKLYAEAVSVLLNWNPRRYETIEEDEAIPQLEYLAYEMCRRGVQRLSEDDVLDLLDKLRAEYPNIRAIRRREAEAFLQHLEERSSILIKSGGIWHKTTKQEKPVWEFRHLTFQEYLAARALLDGRYPGRDKTKSLAEQVAPLAGAVQKTKSHPGFMQNDPEVEVTESWREALRLLVADCKDDDVDDVFLSILHPMDGEDVATTARARAVLAALCLADEPNVAEATADQALAAFATLVRKEDGAGSVRTTVDQAAMEVGASLWNPKLKHFLIDDYCRRSPDTRGFPGSLWGMVEVAGWSRHNVPPEVAFAGLLQRLRSPDRIESISAALTIMVASFYERFGTVADVVTDLFALLVKNGAEGHAAAWALLWLNGGWVESSRKPAWSPSEEELDIMAELLGQVPLVERGFKRCLIHILAKVPKAETVTAILPSMKDSDSRVRRDAAEALAHLGDRRAVAPLLNALDDKNLDVRRAVIGALGKLGDPRAVAPLVDRLKFKDVGTRRAVVAALGRLGDKRAVPPLLGKLNDRDAAVRQDVIGVLAQLGDQRAVAPLVARLEGQDKEASAFLAAALHLLNEPKGTNALRLLLKAKSSKTRIRVIRAFSRHVDTLDQRLLARDLDALEPWLDPQEPITENRVAAASEQLKLTSDEVRSRYERLAIDLRLVLSWKEAGDEHQ